jgi:hypothetical protein
VREQHRRPVAMHLVVKLDAVPVQLRHMRFLFMVEPRKTRKTRMNSIE